MNTENYYKQNDISEFLKVISEDNHIAYFLALITSFQTNLKELSFFDNEHDLSTFDQSKIYTRNIINFLKRPTILCKLSDHIKNFLSTDKRFIVFLAFATSLNLPLITAVPPCILKVRGSKLLKDKNMLKALQTEYSMKHFLCSFKKDYQFHPTLLENLRYIAPNYRTTRSFYSLYSKYHDQIKKIPFSYFIKLVEYEKNKITHDFEIEIILHPKYFYSLNYNDFSINSINRKIEEPFDTYLINQEKHFGLHLINKNEEHEEPDCIEVDNINTGQTQNIPFYVVNKDHKSTNADLNDQLSIKYSPCYALFFDYKKDSQNLITAIINCKMVDKSKLIVPLINAFKAHPSFLTQVIPEKSDIIQSALESFPKLPTFEILLILGVLKYQNTFMLLSAPDQEFTRLFREYIDYNECGFELFQDCFSPKEVPNEEQLTALYKVRHNAAELLFSIMGEKSMKEDLLRNILLFTEERIQHLE